MIFKSEKMKEFSFTIDNVILYFTLLFECQKLQHNRHKFVICVKIPFYFCPHDGLNYKNIRSRNDFTTCSVIWGWKASLHFCTNSLTVSCFSSPFPVKTCEWGEGDRGHHPQASGEADGGWEHPADSGQDQSDPGARPVRQGQLTLPGTGKVHEHTQMLSQHAPSGGLHLKEDLEDQ